MISTFAVLPFHICLEHENNNIGNHPILSILRLFGVNRAIRNSYVFEFVIHWGQSCPKNAFVKCIIVLLRCSDLNAKQQPCLNFKAQHRLRLSQ